MAKRGALEHQKTIELAVILGIDDCFALGVLEAFWQHVARYYPTGDLSTVKPVMLARSIRYSRDGVELWNALLESRFVEIRDGKTIVHDWSEHADDSVHMALARKGLYFADGVKPRMTRLSSAERAQAEQLYTHAERTNAQVSEPCAHGMRTVCALPSHAMPSHGLSHEDPETDMAAEAHFEEQPRTATKSEPVSDEAAERERAEAEKARARQEAAEARKAAEAELEAQWASFLEEYPPRDGDRGVPKGKAKFTLILRGKQATFPELLEGVQRYRRWADAGGQSHTPYVKQIPTWLNGACWKEPWTIIPRPPSGNGSSPVGRNRLSRMDAEAIVASAGLLEVA